MTVPDDPDVAADLTGLCTFLVQGDPFHQGDTVYLTLQRETATDDDAAWLALAVTGPDRERRELRSEERTWGTDTVLVRATLEETGGQPLDSMNQPVGPYDPSALTLSDVRVVDRSPPDDEAVVGSGPGD